MLFQLLPTPFLSIDCWRSLDLSWGFFQGDQTSFAVAEFIHYSGIIVLGYINYEPKKSLKFYFSMQPSESTSY